MKSIDVSVNGRRYTFPIGANILGVLCFYIAATVYNSLYPQAADGFWVGVFFTYIMLWLWHQDFFLKLSKTIAFGLRMGENND